MCWSVEVPIGEPASTSYRSDERGLAVNVALYWLKEATMADHARFEAFEFEQRFFVNPGSATGAWSGLWSGWVPITS